jgi:S-adenosylmethionine synthetase
VYNVLALAAAREIVEQVTAVEDASVYILSQIGAPLEEPLVATALVRPTNGALTPAIQADVEAVLDRSLSDVHGMRELILTQEMCLF